MSRRPSPSPPFECEFDDHFVGQAVDLLMRQVADYLRPHYAFACWLDEQRCAHQDGRGRCRARSPEPYCPRHRPEETTE